MAFRVFSPSSLAIQLAETVRKIRKFLQGVQGAPDAVTRLIEALDDLHGNLNHSKLLVDRLSTTGDSSGSLVALTALEGCRTRVERLGRLGYATAANAEDMGCLEFSVRRKFKITRARYETLQLYCSTQL